MLCQGIAARSVVPGFAHKANQTSLHTRFGLGEDVLTAMDIERDQHCRTALAMSRCIKGLRYWNGRLLVSTVLVA
jgi:hypothetical protein